MSTTFVDDFVIESDTASKPVLEIKNTTNDTDGAILKFVKDSSIPVYGIVERLTSKRSPGFFTEFLIKHAEENLNAMSKHAGDEILHPKIDRL